MTRDLKDLEEILDNFIGKMIKEFNYKDKWILLSIEEVENIKKEILEED